ncbi:MAG: transglutaminase family protein [Solirubrobacterales bacterium]|nr:transglutaminase family protein [Solirubrobacterales bacterium]
MRFSIRYRTEYQYDAPVADNLNSLRALPATTPAQRCEESGVRVDPEARLIQHNDYFGTRVVEFGVSRPHDRLTIDVRAKVETSETPEPPDPSWEALATDAYRRAAAEYLLPSDDEPLNGALDGLRADARGDGPLATLLRVSELIPDRFEYRPGVTYVGSTVQDLLDAGAGVCQDFAHLALILLRRNGIAARYVSGYLFAAPPDDSEDSIEVNTHAWLEGLLAAPGDGAPVWVGIDPTNRGRAGTQHVKIGHGRRYADVPPIKGVYRGSASAELEASVRMTRLDSGNGAAP